MFQWYSNLNTSYRYELTSFSLSSEGLLYAVESLTVYKFEELHKATSFFSEASWIKGSSAYGASLKGDDVAVKVLKGDVSEGETSCFHGSNFEG